MSLGYGLNFYVPDKEGFITGLVAYVRGNLTTDGNVRIKQDSDSLFIGYETMYMYIYLSNYENSCRIVEDRENVKINFDMTVYLYKGKYRQGVIDIAKIVKYYLSNYRGDGTRYLYMRHQYSRTIWFFPALWYLCKKDTFVRGRETN